jgi:caa(3)-type oxidase subunit IV
MAEHHDPHDAHQGDAHHVNYKNKYLTLLALLAVSVAGPFIGVVWVTLITAFGIAIVKANIVIQNFMHLKWERRIAKWFLTTSLVLMALMMAGVSVDVMNHEGNNWENIAAQAAVERGIPLEPGEVEEEAETEAEPVEAAAFNTPQMFGLICGSCHGAAGDGTGPAGAALNPKPANFTDPAFWAEQNLNPQFPVRDRARIIQVITNGGASVGKSPLMVAWNASFTPEQIEQLADHVMGFRPQ